MRERERENTTDCTSKERENNNRDCRHLNTEQEGSIKQSQIVLTKKSSVAPLFEELLENCEVSELEQWTRLPLNVVKKLCLHSNTGRLSVTQSHREFIRTAKYRPERNELVGQKSYIYSQFIKSHVLTDLKHNM